MNDFLNKFYINKLSQLKKSFLEMIKCIKKRRKIFIFILVGFFTLVSGFIFFLQNPDRFSSVNENLEYVDMTGLPLYVEHEVPFTSQAPSKQWHDPLYQDACEETSIIMATHWIAGEKEDIGVGKAEMELEKLFKITEEKYGTSIDMSAEDTAQLLREYSNSDLIDVVYDVTLEDVIRTLVSGKIIIIPADGEWLDNEYFVGTGPERHMVVVIGYDYKKSQFITNDPGTQNGKNFRYSFDNLMSSIRNYKTGKKVSIEDDGSRVMITVDK